MTRDAMQRLTSVIDDAVDWIGLFESPSEEADAHRHVLRLTSAALDLFVERNDPARPLVTEWMSPTRKFLGDSPDTVYTTVPVDAAHRYQLEIDPGDAVYVGAVVYGREAPGGPVHIVASANDLQLERQNGVYRVDIGGEASGPNALPLDGTSFWVMTRRYYADAQHERGSVAVTRTDGAAPDGPPSAAAFTDGLESAAAWVGAQVRADVAIDGLMAYPDGHLAEPSQPIEVPDDLVSLFFPSPDISYQGVRFAAEDQEQIVVSFRPPLCRFWSVTVCNPWLESVEQRLAPASINNTTAVVEVNGEVTIVVAQHDPGRANWIPLRGYRRGQIAYRTVLATETPTDAHFVQQPLQ